MIDCHHPAALGPGARVQAPVLYHITRVAALDAIARQGLVPKTGPRSMLANEPVAAVYFFTSMPAVEDAIDGWLGDVFDEDEPLALLVVDGRGIELAASPAGYEVLSLMPVPASRIVESIALDEPVYASPEPVAYASLHP